MRLRRIAFAAGLTLALACSASQPVAAPTTSRSPGPGSSPGAAASTTTAASSGSFYDPPDPLPSGMPGEIIRSKPMNAAAGLRSWLVLYHSASVAGKDIAVSGVVIAPDRPAPAGGWPVITWAHGTTGAARSCAPSESPNGSQFLSSMAQRGYVVAATDYEGLGGPGVHPYLVGESEGRGTLDAARAARRLPDAHAGSTVVIFGHSQGGHSALFAGQIAPTWAPELNVVGVVAGAPASRVDQLISAAAGSPATFGFFALAVDTWSKTYPEARLDTLMTPQGISSLDIVERQCAGQVLRSFANTMPSSLLKGNITEIQPWARLLQENTAGGVKTPAPILMIQGTSDMVIPIQFNDSFLPTLCARGDTVEFMRYPGADHGTVLTAASNDVFAWIGARLAGAPAPSSCGG
jgi:acetyl esterase/lipase